MRASDSLQYHCLDSCFKPYKFFFQSAYKIRRIKFKTRMNVHVKILHASVDEKKTLFTSNSSIVHPFFIDNDTIHLIVLNLTTGEKVS